MRACGRSFSRLKTRFEGNVRHCVPDQKSLRMDGVRGITRRVVSRPDDDRPIIAFAPRFVASSLIRPPRRLGYRPSKRGKEQWRNREHERTTRPSGIWSPRTSQEGRRGSDCGYRPLLCPARGSEGKVHRAATPRGPRLPAPPPPLCRTGPQQNHPKKGRRGGGLVDWKGCTDRILSTTKVPRGTAGAPRSR